jgi:hypothetical protein
MPRLSWVGRQRSENRCRFSAMLFRHGQTHLPYQESISQLLRKCYSWGVNTVLVQTNSVPFPARHGVATLYSHHVAVALVGQGTELKVL